MFIDHWGKFYRDERVLDLTDRCLLKGAELEVGANGTGSEDSRLRWMLARHLLTQVWEMIRTASAFIFICTSGN